MLCKQSAANSGIVWPAGVLVPYLPSPLEGEGDSMMQQTMMGEGVSSREAFSRSEPLTHQWMLQHRAALSLKGRGPQSVQEEFCRLIKLLHEPTKENVQSGCI